MDERGVTEEEVIEVIRSGEVGEADVGRVSAEAAFDFSGDWQGTYYAQKKVQVIYVEEGEQIVVITVYGFYGSWE